MRILIVDGDESVLKALPHILRLYNMGSEIITAKEGQEGIEQFHQDTFDIVIVDTDVKDQHGLKILEEVKQSCPSVKTFSLVNSPHNLQDVLDLEYVDYALTKPFKAGKFVEEMKECISTM